MSAPEEMSERGVPNKGSDCCLNITLSPVRSLRGIWGSSSYICGSYCYSRSSVWPRGSGLDESHKSESSDFSFCSSIGLLSRVFTENATPWFSERVDDCLLRSEVRFMGANIASNDFLLLFRLFLTFVMLIYFNPVVFHSAASAEICE